MPTADPIRFTSDITVEYVQHAGDDLAIVRAARVSTLGADADRGDESPDAVAGLLRYLVRHRHGSPFECGSLTVRVHAPIFVFREWHRHAA